LARTPCNSILSTTSLWVKNPVEVGKCKFLRQWHNILGKCSILRAISYAGADSKSTAEPWRDRWRRAPKHKTEDLAPGSLPHSLAKRV
jgi:hypothetical protein